MQPAHNVSAAHFHGDHTTNGESYIAALQTTIAQSLTPLVSQIDEQGIYPRAFMRRAGELGAFQQACPSALGGSGVGLKGSIRVIEEVAQTCLSTGFITWCQIMCAWYIQNSENSYLKEQLLPGILTGETLAGTGLSNPLKHYAGLENIYLTAQRGDGGYRINGVVPWVSNIDIDHYIAIAAKVEATSSYIMAMIPANTPHLSLGDGGHFIALEGSSTYSCRFRDTFVPDSYIVADPCMELSKRTLPAIILSQTGFGLGLVGSCIALMRQANRTKGHINSFLPDQVDDIEADLQTTRQTIYQLAEEIGCGERPLRADLLKETVATRIAIAELALRASQATMLHLGSSGYRLHSVAERKLRESYFIAIVTPALKHLKKMQSGMNG
ncbi:MAG TPA: acyl-CoA dehydrogenase family protein [Ktedonobacteraceae bacterium]|jgi:alkylation response protein AidB-like acyl-CoA dehydrogenase|nr:acyl-CoA dehydrogenase family protein [Ktedonobacteraceae bacterium]